MRSVRAVRCRPSQRHRAVRLGLRAALALGFGFFGFGCRDPGSAPPAPPSASEARAGNRLPDWQAGFRYEVAVHGDRLVVEFEVQEGFHVYTVGETVGRPLKLTIDPESPVQPAGPVVYPKGETKQLSIGQSVTVEGAGNLRVPLKMPAEASQVTGRFRYQVCTDSLCDRPRTRPFRVPVKPQDASEAG